MYAANVVSYPCLRCTITRVIYIVRNLSVSSHARVQNHYDILGVPKDATKDDVKEAYFRKSKLLHPDSKPDDPAQHERFVELNDAYAILGKPHSRRDYDLELKGVPRRVHVYQEASTSNPYGSTDEYTHHDYYGFTDASSGKQESYYGIKGLKKVKNSTIVIGCVLILISGAVVHFSLIHFGGLFSRRRLDEKDRKLNQIYSEVKQRARENATMTPLEVFKLNYEKINRKGR